MIIMNAGRIVNFCLPPATVFPGKTDGIGEIVAICLNEPGELRNMKVKIVETDEM